MILSWETIMKMVALVDMTIILMFLIWTLIVVTYKIVENKK